MLVENFEVWRILLMFLWTLCVTSGFTHFWKVNVGQGVVALMMGCFSVIKWIFPFTLCLVVWILTEYTVFL